MTVETETAFAPGGVMRAAWLKDNLLLVVGRFGSAAQGGIEAAAVSNGDRLPLTAISRYLEPVDESGNAVPQRALILRLPAGGKALNGSEAIELGSGEGAVSIPTEAIGEKTTTWLSLVEEELAHRDSYHRVGVLGAILHAAAPCLLEPGGFSLSRVLAALREKLSPHMGSASASVVEPQAIAVDRVIAIDEVSFVVRGWMHDADRDVTRLTAVSPEGVRADFLEQAYRHARPDIREVYSPALDVAREKHGFISFLQLETPSLFPSGWVVEAGTTSRAIEARAPDAVRDLDAARTEVLNLLAHEEIGSSELTEKHLHPALGRLQDRLASLAEVDTVVEVGSPPRSPATSIIVPLYRRTDFLEYQIAMLARDAEIQRADLIFVLDSPELAEVVDREARQLQELHGLSFRLALMNRNAGFANVNNAAASLARGGLLLLLNSDVIPVARGWLGQMEAFYDAMPEIGALGPKLLYEDDSLQHAGMRFDWEPILGAWHNVHYFKGMDRHLPAANVARPVPAVTGAALMIDRELYESFGGLPHMYVQGGYEDSHLCLQLAAEGKVNWYLPRAELYHFEAQSYLFSEERLRITKYNAWLQTRLWGDQMEARLEAGRSAPPQAGGA